MEHVRHSAAGALLAILILVPGCMADNLAKWADTRLDSPAEEQLRHSVGVLFIFPALAGDIVLLPLQLVAGFHPYGDLCAPDSEAVRYRLDDQRSSKSPGRAEISLPSPTVR